jgi:putative transposase
MSANRRKRRSPDQIISALRKADGLLSGGQTIARVCQKLGVCEQTYHRWHTEYGVMKADAMKR